MVYGSCAWVVSFVMILLCPAVCYRLIHRQDVYTSMTSTLQSRNVVFSHWEGLWLASIEVPWYE